MPALGDLSVMLTFSATVSFPGERAPCGCPQWFASQSNKLAVFANLNCFQRYYPMVALNQALALYGPPPRPVSPFSLREWTESRRTMKVGMGTLGGTSEMCPKLASSASSMLLVQLLRKRQRACITDLMKRCHKSDKNGRRQAKRLKKT